MTSSLPSTVSEIADLLTRHGHPGKAVWIEEQLRLLGAAQSEDARCAVLSNLHGIVMGMGGLFDLSLEAETERERLLAKDRLDELADKLFELTR